LSVTLIDIARKAKVSQGTASRVLSGGQIRVSEKTRKRIQKIAKELNYMPNVSAQTLKTGRFYNIAVVAYDITDAFAVECVRTIEAYLETTAYRATWISCANKPQEDARRLLQGIAHTTDGLIVIAANNYLSDADLLQLWATRKIPIVSIIRRLPGDLVPSVRMNNDASMRLLMNHLDELGHRRVAMCYDRSMHPSASQRFRTYKACLQEFGLPDEDSLQVGLEGITLDDGYKAGLELLKNNPLPTAIIAFNDLTAFGIIAALFENGVKVPDDVSVAGFDDIRMAKYYTPSLTTVAADYEQIAKQAADKLISLVNEPDNIGRQGDNIILMPKLKIRSSTAKARSL
jgi:DNA-binding LacI/PurR family transcriptional regulator